MAKQRRLPSVSRVALEPSGKRAGAVLTNYRSAECRPLVDDHHSAAVLRPGRLVRTNDRRALLAVADRVHAPGVDALRDEEVLGRGRTALTERDVVLARAALIAVAFD